jgi:glycosyltransferase involved in cell wall biosynthesis
MRQPEPLVSALMPAYNAAPYIAEAIESALAQDWPQDRLELIVVDDGSTDDTAEIAARYPVKLIRQANGGPCAAVNTALKHERGERIALLDADDAWPVDKLRVQGALLDARPEVGLVYGDMRVVDADGAVIQESWLENEPIIPEGRCAAEILAGNPATASSILMRASVAQPIPPEIPYTDWWFAARAAVVSELAYLPEPRTLYRFHGGNITLGVQGANAERELRKAIRLVHYFLARMPDGAPTARGLAAAWNYYEYCARTLGEPLPSGEPVVFADGLAARARAAAANPDAGRDALRDAIAAELGRAEQRIVLAFAEELLDGGMAAWVAAMTGEAHVTLAVVTPPELTEALGDIVPDDLDVVAIAAPEQLSAVHALFSDSPRTDPAVPRYGPAALKDLVVTWNKT